MKLTMIGRKVPVTRFMHMSVTREYLLRFLDAHPGEFADLVEGAESYEQARQFLRTGPASHPIGNCPEYTHEHGCPGHDRKDGTA